MATVTKLADHVRRYWSVEVDELVPLKEEGGRGVWLMRGPGGSSVVRVRPRAPWWDPSFERLVMERCEQRIPGSTPTRIAAASGRYFEEQEEDGSVISVESFLDGTSGPPFLTPKPLEVGWLSRGAALLARLHGALAPFLPTIHPPLPPLDGLYETWRRTCPHLSSVAREVVEQTGAPLRGDLLAALPRQVVHGDFHPGNVMFGACDATFDFEYARVDVRLFDLAYGAVTFARCAGGGYEETAAGIGDFVEGYHHACSLGGGTALDRAERQLLPMVITAVLLCNLSHLHAIGVSALEEVEWYAGALEVLGVAGSRGYHP